MISDQSVTGEYSGGINLIMISVTMVYMNRNIAVHPVCSTPRPHKSSGTEENLREYMFVSIAKACAKTHTHTAEVSANAILIAGADGVWPK